ncbi:MAG TPA: DHA2 family efflux MFS transporter permease subunit [Pseudolabrys sp.]|nr:DHA2 family efflux MFS transporter permease subunit [Pseudolabrys sp.]
MASAAEHQASLSVTFATWTGFAAMCVGMFMAILDVQVVATSLPTIQQALSIAQEQMSWIQTAYLIAEIISIPLAGLFTRILTMRWLFVLAVSTFTLASTGCAASGGFASLIVWRVIQGFSGGTLIPAVFSAVFLLFPYRRHSIATTIAGVVAVLAPTVGPVVGGWITDTFSWQWLFLINVIPGLLAALVASFLLPQQRLDLEQARHLDVPSLALIACALAALEIAIKEAPERSWMSPLVAVLLAATLLAGAAFVWRTLRAPRPLVDLRLFADRRFAVGCLLSFALGIGLYGSVYLMPVFLAYVRGHHALQVGEIMLVTGIAQFATAPIAVALAQRFDERRLTAAGFLLFACGLGMSAMQTGSTDYAEMFWPQAVRGIAIMFCILPPTQLALEHLAKSDIPDASGLFNMARNLGGAIGIALIDTILYSRAPIYAGRLGDQLAAGDLKAVRTLGIPPAMVDQLLVDPNAPTIVAPLVEKQAFVEASNDAWALVALLTVTVLIALPLARSPLQRAIAAVRREPRRG